MNGALWSQDELARALGAEPSAALRTPVSGVSIDTRTLAPGDLFIAIKGDMHDGHAHVGAAFAAGAAAVVAAAARAGEVDAHGAIFAVDDPLLAMQRLGVAARARSRAGVAAVTGSVGKTSAKEMLRLVLSSAGQTHASAASYNNHWGVPLTLSRMPSSASFGVFEIGMNHAGEITPLVAMVRPHVALITTIAAVHVEHLGSLENIALAKAEIFDGLQSCGVAVLNSAAPYFDLLMRKARQSAAHIRRFGADAQDDARLIDYAASEDGSIVNAQIDGAPLRFKLNAPGLHHAENALGVILAAQGLGVEAGSAAAALAEFQPQKGRGERLILQCPSGAIVVIDESYNANPASMRAALALLGAAKPGAGGRRIAVIGDMLELGAAGPASHADLATTLAREGIDLLFAAGPLSRHLFDAAPASLRGGWTERAADMQDALLNTVRGGDVVMIKGSNGSRMGPVVAALKDHFSSAAKQA